MSNRRHFQDYLLKSLEATNQLRQSKTTLDAELARCGIYFHVFFSLCLHTAASSWKRLTVWSEVVLEAATIVLALARNGCSVRFSAIFLLLARWSCCAINESGSV